MAATSKVVAQQIKIPPNYICSITGQIMADPVFAADGYTYEHEAIEDWLKTHDTSSKTSLKLKHKDLVENHDKREEILEFLKEHLELYREGKVYLPKAWVNELIVAIKANKIKEVQEYLARDQRLLTLKLQGEYTAFHLACQFGSPDLTENLLKTLESEKLLDKISAKPKDFNPIHLNILLQRSLEQGSGYPFPPSLLLKLGVDLEQAEDSSGNSLLQRFVIQGNLEAVQWLIKQGVSLESRSRNLEGNTPLALSILHGRVAITDYLLQSGASVEALGEQQKSPFYLAVERKDSKESQELIELLLSKGANPRICCGTEKLTPLHIAAQAGNVNAAKALLKVKVNFDALSASGDTPLHLAAKLGQKEVIPLLLEAGASRKPKNADGKTPIEVASLDIADLIKQTARQIKQARFAEVEVLRELVKEQSSRIAQLEKELAQMKLKVTPERDIKEKSEALSSGPAITPQYQAQSKPSPKVDVKVNAEDVQKFLDHVAAGAQPEAEEMLKKNPELALATGTVTDHAKRTFKNITGFQYAVWALDWHMWRMIRKYLPKEAAEEQSKGFAEGSWVKEHSEHVSWQKLIDAQQTYIDNHKKWDSRECGKHWIQQVGAAQLNLPIHVLQEYCQPDRPFAPFGKTGPCPNFYDFTGLVRMTEGIDMYALGVRTGIVRAWWTSGVQPHWAAIMSYNEPLAYPEKEMEQWKNNQCGMFARSDHNALLNLFNTRTQQRDLLVAELVKKPGISLSK